MKEPTNCFHCNKTSRIVNTAIVISLSVCTFAPLGDDSHTDSMQNALLPLILERRLEILTAVRIARSHGAEFTSL